MESTFTARQRYQPMVNEVPIPSHKCNKLTVEQLRAFGEPVTYTQHSLHARRWRVQSFTRGTASKLHYYDSDLPMSESGAEGRMEHGQLRGTRGALPFSLKLVGLGDNANNPNISRRGALGLGAAAVASMVGLRAPDAKAQGVTREELDRQQKRGQEIVNEHVSRLKAAYPVLGKEPYNKLEFAYVHHMTSSSRIVTTQFNGVPLDGATFRFDPFGTRNNQQDADSLFFSGAFRIYARENIAPPLTLVFRPENLKAMLVNEGFTFFGTGRLFSYSSEEELGYELFDPQTKEVTFTLKDDGSVVLTTNDGWSDTFRRMGNRWALVARN